MLCGAGLHEMVESNVYVGYNLRNGKKFSYRRCQECRSNADRKSRQTNQSNRATYAKQYRKSHRLELAAASKNTRKSIKTRVYAKLGNRCANPKCLWINEDGTSGCTDFRCLQIDHVNDDGTSSGDRALKSGYKFYLKVINDTKGLYQLLCANCNWIKRHANE